MRISLTEYIVILVMLIAIACGAYKFYERNLSGVTQATAERIVSHE